MGSRRGRYNKKKIQWRETARAILQSEGGAPSPFLVAKVSRALKKAYGRGYGRAWARGRTKGPMAMPVGASQAEIPERETPA